MILAELYTCIMITNGNSAKLNSINFTGRFEFFLRTGGDRSPRSPLKGGTLVNKYLLWEARLVFVKNICNGNNSFECFIQ